MQSYFGDIWIARLLVQRGIAAMYLIAFIVVLRQFKPLLGERGLLPVPAYVKGTRFLESPGLFSWRYSDRLLDYVGWTGLVLAGFTLSGIVEEGPVWISIAVGLSMWFLYLSVVNVGQTFYGFGWESMLLEAGFFTAFMGTARLQPSIVPMLILRWMLFRTEMGAGLIKLRHDRCWRDLTCLFYHYETQPLPNPLSWYFHRLPSALHRFSALFSHFVQVVVPFALFAPQPYASAAAVLIIFHQFWLIVSGNYSWLNWLTVVLGVTALDDHVLRLAVPLTTPALLARPLAFDVLLYVVAGVTVVLSIQPALNLLSNNQAMNRSYNPLHLVNAYGAFGNVGKKRYEIVIEGTEEALITPYTKWREYGFKAKPVNPMKMPPHVAPYHLRLDWLVWFLPFSVTVTSDGIRVWGHQLWFARLVQKLLTADDAILRLMGSNPFPGHGPAFVRASFYEYRFTTWREKRETGAWWKRRLIGVYLPPVSLNDLREL